MSLFLEDFHPGDVHEFGSTTVDAAEILDFARRFDPQPFHLDPEAAARSPFGGLIASGWHTAALAMRMIVTEFLGNDSGSLGSPGTDEIRWRRPVRPGDRLSMRAEVLAVTPSRSRPDRGVVRTRFTVLNQDREEVMTMIALGLFRRRCPPPDESRPQRTR